MVLTTVPCYWITSAVLSTTTSLSYSVFILPLLIVDMWTATIMMLLCLAVSILIVVSSIYIHYNLDATRIWDSNPYPGMIRLQGGIYSNEGRVEVYCNGQWGTICIDGFDSTDALVLCKQLGYSNYISYNHLTLYVYIVKQNLLVYSVV